MSGNVVKLQLVSGVGEGRRIRVNGVLAGARKAKLTECVVIGYTPEGDLYGASSEGPGDTMWLVEAFKKWLLEGCPAEEVERGA